MSDKKKSKSHETLHQVLHIRVLRADGLKKVDTIGWADGYVIIKANGTKIGKTKIKKNKKAPVWDETFDVDIHHGHVDLTFELYDWNAVAKHVFLGMVKIDGNEAGAHYDRHNVKFELQKDPSKKDKKRLWPIVIKVWQIVLLLLNRYKRTRE